MSLKNLLAITLLGGLVLLASTDTAKAFHTVFDYEIERFEVIGNRPDGLINEFDDGVQDWPAPIGTVTESDGALHLKSPGEHYPFLNSNTLVVDRSDAIADGFVVVNGEGDFTGIATLRQMIPDEPGGYFALNLIYEYDVLTREHLTLSYANVSDAVAAAINNISDTGFSGSGLNLAMSRYRFAIDGSEFEILDHQLVNIPESAVTGDILFRMTFIDSNDSIVGSISTDGGTTYMNFNSVSWSPPSFAVWTLFGDPITLAPAAVPTGPTWVLAVVLLLFCTFCFAFFQKNGKGKLRGA